MALYSGNGDQSDLGELLRRQRLAQQFAFAQPQTPMSLQDQIPPAPPAPPDPTRDPSQPQPTQQIAPPPSDRPARAAYMAALGQPPPERKPLSTGRKILGAIAGGLAGMHDPRSGIEVGRAISEGPYEKQLSDYEKKVARLKEAYGVEEATAKDTIEERLKKAQAGEAEARLPLIGAQKEEAEATAAEKKYKISPQAKQDAIDVATSKARASGRYPPTGIGTLKEGAGFLALHEDKDGNWVDSDGRAIDETQFDKIEKIGTPVKPEKETTTEKDIDDWLKRNPGKNRQQAREALAGGVAMAKVPAAIAAAEGKPPAPVAVVDKQGNVITVQPKGPATSKFPEGGKNIPQAGQESGKIQILDEAVKYATDYDKAEHTGPGDEALLDRFLAAARRDSGVRQSQALVEMAIRARSWKDSVEAQARHALTGTWFSDDQRSKIVRTMKALQAAEPVRAPELDAPKIQDYVKDPKTGRYVPAPQ